MRAVRGGGGVTIPEKDYTLSETAEALRISTKSLRKRIKDGQDPESNKPAVEHLRRGNRIMFTAGMVEKLRMADVVSPPVEQSITTGKKRAV